MRLTARVHAGSGAIAGYKGDMTKGQFLIESKATENQSMSLKLDWLRKVSAEALAVSKHPALLLQFIDGEADLLPCGGWIMMREDTFLELVG